MLEHLISFGRFLVVFKSSNEFRRWDLFQGMHVRAWKGGAPARELEAGDAPCVPTKGSSVETLREVFCSWAQVVLLPQPP